MTDRIVLAAEALKSFYDNVLAAKKLADATVR